MLIAFNRNTIDQKNKHGRTPLIAATTTGKTEVVKFLLENGASITEDYGLLNCLDWCLIKNDKDTAMVMMLDTRWNKVSLYSYKLFCKMNPCSSFYTLYVSHYFFC